MFTQFNPRRHKMWHMLQSQQKNHGYSDSSEYPLGSFSHFELQNARSNFSVIKTYSHKGTTGCDTLSDQAFLFQLERPFL